MPGPAFGSVAWRQRDSALTRTTPRAVLILSEEVDEPVRLAGAAALVWDELAAPLTDAALVDRVAARIGSAAADNSNDLIATRTALALIGAVAEVR
jgi:hypothetical protein